MADTMMTSHLQFRRRVYTEGLWVEESRELPQSPYYMRLLLPWLQRELEALLHHQRDQMQLMGAILLELSRVDLRLNEFSDTLRHYLGPQTSHFLHEFFVFSGSQLSMEDYDLVARYPLVIPSPQVTSDDECLVVGSVRPRSERTPEIVDLSKDDDDASAADIASDPVLPTSPYLHSQTSPRPSSPSFRPTSPPYCPPSPPPYCPPSPSDCPSSPGNCSFSPPDCSSSPSPPNFPPSPPNFPPSPLNFPPSPPNFPPSPPDCTTSPPDCPSSHSYGPSSPKYYPLSPPNTPLPPSPSCCPLCSTYSLISSPPTSPSPSERRNNSRQFSDREDHVGSTKKVKKLKLARVATSSHCSHFKKKHKKKKQVHD